MGGLQPGRVRGLVRPFRGDMPKAVTPGGPATDRGAGRGGVARSPYVPLREDCEVGPRLPTGEENSTADVATPLHFFKSHFTQSPVGLT